jgi:hypothetical protein
MSDAEIRTAAPGRAAPPKRATARELDYFRRLGEWEAENERLEWERHMALSLDERLERTWRLSLHAPGRVKRASDVSNSGFYERAVRLGAYRR